MSENIEKFNSVFYEISSKKTKGGKREVKLVLHEIFPDNKTWQDNGISWNEEYTLNSLESLKGAPLAVQFIDDKKSEIWGHGYIGDVDGENGKIPIFESEVVGSFIDGYIDDIEIKGEIKHVLIGRAYIYEQRYKNFVDWLITNVPLGNVMGSIEINGLPENKNEIIYEDGFKETGRVPMVYCYSGHALLSKCVKPADQSAVVLEINEKQNKEEDKMDEKILNQVVLEIKNTIVETNSKNQEQETKITELNTQNLELNASVEQLTAALEATKAEIKAWEDKYDILWKETGILREEIAKAEVKAKVGELNSALSEFTDEEKAYAKTEIEAFETEPLTSEINTVVSKIYTEIGKKSKEAEALKTSEQNESKTKEEDIFGEIESVSKTDNDDDISIF